MIDATHAQSAQNGSVFAQKGAFPHHIGQTKDGLNSKLSIPCVMVGGDLSAFI
ncbi:hypothetical protein [Acetobacter aceti]|uniref:hypothetical protein n=1 Tax=Acetobacter aceti TaxID=435 RepID=UPI002153905A|nr:hypothetical protein [Acetobacter aceti]